MAVKFPVEYEVSPDHVASGMRWLTVRVKNVGEDELSGLDIRLNSLDAYNISVTGTGEYIAALRPDEEQTKAFQVSANLSGRLYLTLDGWRDGDPFHWESPAFLVTVGEEVAELKSLFAMTEPYPNVRETVRCEATVRGLAQSAGLTLEFWVEEPDGTFEEMGTVETRALGAGDTATYTAEMTVDEEGVYTVYAYLYDGVKRIGREIEHVFARPQ